MHLWDRTSHAAAVVFIGRNRVGLGHPVTESVSILNTKQIRSKNKLQKEAAPPQGFRPDFGGPFTHMSRARALHLATPRPAR